MSDYAHRPGGALKFKGEGEKKKKKSRSTSERVKLEAELKEKTKEREKVEEGSEKRDDEGVPEKASGSGSGSAAASTSGGRKLTEAERRFEETQRKRRHERVAKLAGQTHKDRVQEFNAKLDLLSEHHDLPRIGPG